MIWLETPTDTALLYNQAIVKSAKMPDKRNTFMRDIEKKSFSHALKNNEPKKPSTLRRYLSAIKRKLFRK